MWEIAKSIIFKAIVDALFGFGRTLYKLRREKDTEFDELKDKLQSGDLKFGDQITIIGTYSEFVPFVNMSRIVRLARDTSVEPLPTVGTCKVGPVNDEYVGALLKEDAKGISDGSPCIPVFFSHKYSKNSTKMHNYMTGSILELRGEISPIPSIWRDIILPKNFFSFERADGEIRSFCLRIRDCEPYGIHLDQFRSDLWSLAHFQGTQIPISTPDLLSILEADAPDRLVIENIFPGAFQFIFPKVNLMNAEYRKECKSALTSFASDFPSDYFSAVKLLGDREISAFSNRKKSIEYIYDASFDHFESRSIAVKPLTSRYFEEIDRSHEVAFGHLSKAIQNEWEQIKNIVIKEARRHPKALGDALILGSVAEILFDQELEKTHLEYPEDTESEPVSHLNWQFQTMVSLGYYIKKYGHRGELIDDAFTLDELVELFNAYKSNPQLIRISLFPMLLSLVRKGYFTARESKNGREISFLKEKSIF